MKAIKVSVELVFDATYLESNYYVDLAMQADPDDIATFLIRFYLAPHQILDRLDAKRIRGGLRAIVYSSGFQSQVFYGRGGVALPERLAVLEASYSFFESYLVRQPELADICSMWWDDLGVALSYPDPEFGERESEDQDLSALRAKLLKLLTQALSVPSRQAHLSALRGLECLQHPETRIVISDFLSNGGASIDSTARAYARSIAEQNT